jgi:hypothetical protein
MPQPQPVAMPQPAPVRPVATPQPVAPVPVTPQAMNAPANPFADFDAPTASTSAPASRPAKDDTFDEDAPRKKKKRDRDRDRDEDDRDDRDRDRKRDEQDAREDRKEKPARASYSRDAAKSGGGGGGGLILILLLLVSGYALLATGLAVYGLFFKSGDKSDTGHPLSTIPDNFGEFPPAARKKVTQYKFNVDGELHATQCGALGEKITVGQMEIQPIDIVKRPLTIEIEGKNESIKLSPGTALVLRLEIKNKSDMSIYPMDPAFTRKASAGDKPITRIVVNKNTVFPGGAIPWPNSDQIVKRMETQQKNDFVPLAPGESREYVVFSDASADLIRAVERSGDVMQWRVQVRRDPVMYRGKEVPVTAIIGVDFSARDIRK